MDLGCEILPGLIVNKINICTPLLYLHIRSQQEQQAFYIAISYVLRK
jgi:hypothetical protein